MKKPLVGHSAPSGVCSNALVLARKLYVSLRNRSVGNCTWCSGDGGCRTAPIVHLPAQTNGNLSLSAICLRDKKRAALGRGADLVGKGHRLVDAIEEFDGHKDHLFVAKVLKVMDLELTRSVSFMAGLARLVRIFDGAAVVDVLATAPAGHRCPKIIEHMAVEADPLTRRQPDDPYAHPVALRK